MKILLTGGAGYVGSACARYLIARGHEAVVIDNLVQGHPAAIGNARLIEGDIAETELVADTLAEMKADAVMHFAAATNVGESVENPEYHYSNNISGTLSLLNAMRKAGVKRMLFSSTCATYGMAGNSAMDEKTPQSPHSPYARTKLAVEWMIRDFADAYGLGFTLLRYFNAAGASPDGEFGEYHRPELHLIPIVLEVPLGQRDRIKVFGDHYPTPDGTCIRDYIHIDDLASAHLLAIENTRSDTAEVYNIGTGKGYSVLEIITACKRVTGQDIAIEITVPRPGDPPILVADPTKLQTQLGWKPCYTSIDEIVSTAWQWHQKHPHGYEGR